MKRFAVIALQLILVAGTMPAWLGGDAAERLPVSYTDPASLALRLRKTINSTAAFPNAPVVSEAFKRDFINAATTDSTKTREDHRKQWLSGFEARSKDRGYVKKIEPQRGPELAYSQRNLAALPKTVTPDFSLSAKDYSSSSGSLPAAVQNSIEGRVFNVANPAFGCKADDSTNNITCARAAVAALNANGGGVLLFPDGLSNTYRFDLGNPSVETSNYTNISDNNAYAALNITASGVIVRLGSPDVRIRVRASYITQATSGSPTPTATTATAQVFLFIGAGGSNTVDDFRIDGNGGQFSLEANGASFTATQNGVNSFFWLYAINLRRGLMQDLRVNWPAAVTTITGQSESFGSSLGEATEMTWRNIIFTYASAGHDPCIYTEGRATIENCAFINDNGYSSKAVYIGADRPVTNVLYSYFENIDNASRNTKTAVALYGENPIPGDEQSNRWQNVIGNTFIDCYAAMNVEIANSCCVTKNVNILYNRFIHTAGTGNYAAQLVKLRHSTFSFNYIEGYNSGADFLGGQNVTVIGNVAKNNGWTDSGQAQGTFNVKDTTSVAGYVVNKFVIQTNIISEVKTSGSGMLISGTDMNVNNNLIDVGSNAGVEGIHIGWNSAGSQSNNISLIDNKITGVGSATTYGFNTANIAGVNVRIGGKGTRVNFSTAGYVWRFTVGCTGCEIADGIFETASLGTFVSNSLTCDWKVYGVKLTGAAASLGFSNVSTCTFELKNTTISVVPTGNTTGLRNRAGNTVAGNFEFVSSSTFAYTPLAGLFTEHRLVATGAAHTISNPIQGLDNQFQRFKLTNHSGGTTWTWGSEYSLGTNCTLDTAASKINHITFRRDNAASKWYAVGCIVGQ